jgi:SAM-dependent methyltransferase
MQDVSSIDWNEVWKSHGLESRKNRGFRTCAERWDDRGQCRKYDLMAKRDDWKRSRDMIARMYISPSDRVLDIGAGPGTLAIPLAGMVRHVTAVEPSPGMIDCLRDNIRSGGVGNVDLVPKVWEDTDIEKDLDAPYDVVVASYSLGFDDLKGALLKMDAASCGYVYVFWFADMKSPWQQNYGEIWERLYGVPPRSAGYPNIVFNLLAQAGILASVEIFREEMVSRFASVEDAVTDQRHGLNITSPEQEAILRDFLAKKLQEEDGMYVMRTMSHRAKIWWKKEN